MPMVANGCCTKVRKLSNGWYEIVRKGAKGAQRCARVRKGVQGCARVRKGAQGCARVRKGAQRCARVRKIA